MEYLNIKVQINQPGLNSPVFHVFCHSGKQENHAIVAGLP